MEDINKNLIVNTPYDDVFRTLSNDCSDLLLPMLRELFGIEYSGEEHIVFYPNEHFLNQQDGAEEKRITDSCFKVIGKQNQQERKFLLECQSTADNSMLLRIFEYATQVALDQGTLGGSTLTVTIPHCGVLFLRSSGNTPDSMTIRIETPDGTVSFPVMVMKIGNYPLSELFEKGLLFLLPFYIFTYEKAFPEYEKNESKLGKLKEEYAHIARQLEKLERDNMITAYTKLTLLEMTNKVVENIAKKYENIRKGVKSVMGGKILEYEAKTILNQGFAKGKEIGFSDGKKIGFSDGKKIGFSEGKDSGFSEGKAIEIYHLVQTIMEKLNLSASQACDFLEIDMEEYEKGKRYFMKKDE